MANIPGTGYVSLPSADLDIKPMHYLHVFKKFCMAENDALSLVGINEYELKLCELVDRAYSRHDECAPKQAIMKSAMEICKGAMNPVDVRCMIDGVYDFYYGITNE